MVVDAIAMPSQSMTYTLAGLAALFSAIVLWWLSEHYVKQDDEVKKK